MNIRPKASLIPPRHAHTFYSGSPEPIGLEYIAGSLVAAGIPAQLTSPNELRASVPGFHSEFSLFSSTTAEYPRVCIEAAQAKNDGRITVIGGYHACGCTNDTLNGPFDYAISGEGELAAVELIRTIVDGTSNCIRNGDRTGVSPRHFVADRLTDLDALPFPLRSEARLGTYIPYDLMWPAHSQQKNIAIVLASRGCDHSCSFCASQTVWGTGVRFRSPENVVREIRDLKSQFDTNTVVFVDQSLGQVKEWTIDLCNTLESSRLNLSWYHMSNLDIDREALAAMGRAGCRKIGLGIDGLSPRAMELMKPLNSQNTESINELLDYCNSLGIFVKAYLMIGSPWETEDDIKEYMEHIGNIRANEIKISYLTPFPGTRDWDRYSPHLLTKDWSHFDTVSMPVVYNPIISVQQYHEIRTRLFRAFYGSKTYADVTKRMLDKYPHYIESYREFLYYLKTFDMISGEEAWIRLINDQNKTIAYSSAPPEGNVI